MAITWFLLCNTHGMNTRFARILILVKFDLQVMQTNVVGQVIRHTKSKWRPLVISSWHVMRLESPHSRPTDSSIKKFFQLVLPGWWTDIKIGTIRAYEPFFPARHLLTRVNGLKAFALVSFMNICHNLFFA